MKNAICNEIIELATERNIDNWMDFVCKVKDSFPGLETKEALDEHRKTVLEFMDKGSAICAKTGNKIVGTLLFSKETNTLCFLAVDAEYRRQHIAEKMFFYMLTLIDSEKDITVTRRSRRFGNPKPTRASEYLLPFLTVTKNPKLILKSGL